MKQGIKVPYSKLKHPAIDSMIENGIVSKQIISRSKAMVYIVRPESLDAYLNNHYAISDLDAYIDYLSKGTYSRAEGIDAAGDSKIRSVRTFKGFLVSSYSPVKCIYKDSELIINPIEGTFIFIYDYESFIPGKEITIVGIENPEVFRNIHKCKHLFDQADLLFVCRYPQTKDLVKWLKMIPNKYIHFGDFDYAGINIYMNEYKKHLAQRASFLIPDNVKELLNERGNRENYLKQVLQHDPKDINEEGIIKLVVLIEKYKKGLEQEIFVL